MTPYMLYSRLGVHVVESDERVVASLHELAGGRDKVTPELEQAVLAEHKDARELHASVVTGRF